MKPDSDEVAEMLVSAAATAQNPPTSARRRGGECVDGGGDHGFCARSEADPEFDRACLSPRGESFDPDLVNSANQRQQGTSAVPKYNSVAQTPGLSHRDK